MTRLHRLWVRNTRCRATTHTLDWLMTQMTGVRQCRYCEHPMPEPRPLVGSLHADQGD